MDIVSKLKNFDWDRHGVLYAVLFGSALRSNSFEDIDIAVFFERNPSIDQIHSLVRDLADFLEVSDDRIDLVVLNRSDTPCVVIEEALGKGKLVYCRDNELCLDDIVKKLEICWDFEISYRKLNLLEVAIEAVKRRWGFSEGSWK